MKTKLMFAACLSLGMLMASCGGGDVKNSKEYKELKAELDKIKAQDSLENAQINAYKKLNDDFMAGKKEDFLGGLADGYIDHNPDTMMTKKTGKEACAEMFDMVTKANTEMTMTYTFIYSEGDMVFVHGKMGGKNTGDMGPMMPATNKSYNVDFWEAVKYENGKIKERWGIMDMFAMMNQLGIKM